MTELETHLQEALKALQSEFDEQQAASLQALAASQAALERLSGDYEGLRTQVETLSGRVRTLVELLRR